MMDQDEAGVALSFFAFSTERRRFPILLELLYFEDMRDPEDDLRGSWALKEERGGECERGVEGGGGEG